MAPQHWAGTPMEAFVPPVVLAEAAAAPVVRPVVEDCVSVDVRMRHAEVGGSRKARVERHQQTSVKVTTAPVPYAASVRALKTKTIGSR